MKKLLVVIVLLSLNACLAAETGRDDSDTDSTEDALCGNGTYGGEEDFSLFYGSYGTCGNGWCEFDEAPCTCPEDCDYCGDGYCRPDLNESPWSCQSDCGGYCGDDHCNASEYTTCPADCPSICHPEIDCHLIPTCCSAPNWCCPC